MIIKQYAAVIREIDFDKTTNLDEIYQLASEQKYPDEEFEIEVDGKTMRTDGDDAIKIIAELIGWGQTDKVLDLKLWK